MSEIAEALQPVFSAWVYCIVSSRFVMVVIAASDIDYKICRVLKIGY
jgi:hypothetical protein